jgi:glycine cleavage system H protein
MILASIGLRNLRAARAFSSFYYTADHEWINYDKASSTGLIGITDYAQSVLGEIVHLDLPKLNEKYSIGDVLGVVECVKAVADIYSPLTGQVVEVNTALEGQTELINSSPEDKAWMAKMTVDKPEELAKLMDKQKYLKFVSEISH